MYSDDVTQEHKSVWCAVWECDFLFSLGIKCLCLHLSFVSVNAQVLAMGGSKSKPKESGQRPRNLDGLSSGGGVSGHHHNSNQQSLTPNRSPAMEGGLPGGQSMVNNAELSLFGGVDNNSVTTSNRITLAGESNVMVSVCAVYGVTRSITKEKREPNE